MEEFPHNDLLAGDWPFGSWHRLEQERERGPLFNDV